jgi:hypothetical protein
LTKTTPLADAKTKPSRRRRVRRYIWAAVCGVVLAFPVVFFFARVYNPFEAGFGDRTLLTVAPEEADVVLFIPRVPEVLGKIRDRGFVAALDRSVGFQEFLRSDFARETGALDALRNAFAELDRLRAETPFGLDLYGDVTGDELVAAAWRPEKPGAPWDWQLAFRPKSWLVVAGVNALLDAFLTDMALQSRLDSAGIVVDRARDSAALTFRDGRRVRIARVRDAIVVGTRDAEVARMKTSVEREGLPLKPADRFRTLADGIDTAWSEIRALVRRDAADDQLGLTRRLEELWGPGDVRLLRSLLPRMSGEDLTARLRVEDSLTLRFLAPEGVAAADDLSPSYRIFGRPALDRALQDDGRFLPPETFAFGRFDVEMDAFLRALFRRPEVFSEADLSNLTDAFAATPEFGSIPGFVDKVSALCDGGVSIGFFKQEREAGERPTPGFAVVLTLRDEASARAIAWDLKERVRTNLAEGRRQAVKDLVARSAGDVDLYEIVLAEGIVTDPRTTKLGFAAGKGRLVVTNWFPALVKLGDRLGGTTPSAADSKALQKSLAYAPEAIRTGWALDAAKLFDWMDQSAPGWAYLRTTDTGVKQVAWRAEGERVAVEAGLARGTIEFERKVAEVYDRLRDQESRVARPELERRIKAYLDQFRGLALGAGLFVGGRGDVEFGFAVELLGPTKG